MQVHALSGCALFTSIDSCSSISQAKKKNGFKLVDIGLKWSRQPRTGIYNPLPRYSQHCILILYLGSISRLLHILSPPIPVTLTRLSGRVGISLPNLLPGDRIEQLVQSLPFPTYTYTPVSTQDSTERFPVSIQTK